MTKVEDVCLGHTTSDNVDPVVDVVDVVFSKTLMNFIHVLQYPLRPVQRSFSTIETQSRWKPKSEILEIEVTTPLQSPILPERFTRTSYSQNNNAVSEDIEPKREREDDVLRRHVAHPGEEDVDMDPMKLSLDPKDLKRDVLSDASGDDVGNDSRFSFQKRKFVSTHVSLGIPYCVGVIRDRRLFLVPIKGMFQMRPDFRCLDEEEEEQQRKNRLSETFKEDELPVDTEPPPMECDDTRSDKAASITSLQLQLVRRETERAEAARKRTHAHFQKQIEEELWIPMEFLDHKSLATHQLYETLFHGDFEKPIFFHDQAPHQYLNVLTPGYSFAPNGHHSLSSQVWPLNELKRLNVVDRLKKLLHNAQVIRFQRLYELMGFDGHDPHVLLNLLEKTGIMIEGTWTLQSELIYRDYMVICRDYMLYLFKSQGHVERNSFSSVIKLPHEKTKQLLSSVATLHDADRKWRWKLGRDEEFLQKYPDFVKKMEELTESRLKSVLGLLRIRDMEVASNLQPETTILLDPSRKPFLDVRSNSLDMQSMATTTTTQVGGGSARFYNPSSTSSIHENLESHLHRFIVQVLSRYGVVSRELLHQRLAYHMADPRYDILRGGIPAEVLDRQLRSLTEELHDVFVLKESDMPSYNDYRRIIIDLFRQKPDKTLKKSDILGAIDKLLGKSLPNIAYSKIMKEIAIARGAQWTLKSGSGQETTSD